MSEELIEVEIKKVVGPTSNGAAVLIGNDEKTFVIFIGFYEAAALLREIKDEQAPRPLTHDLLQSVFLGFDIGIRQIIISDIVENAFCATLILEQREHAAGDLRNEVRIDARPSDCMVLAVKNQSDLFVTRGVFDQVQDFSDFVNEDASTLGSLFAGELSEEELATRTEGLPIDFPEVSTSGDGDPRAEDEETEEDQES
ncbi:MAG: bifunctional nuclease family protein [Planctomycetes bacterium]|nr:bifunctional nuclease family protein [Planctomycetota bacterium]